MNNTITKNETLKKTAVFNKNGDNWYELTISTESKKDNSILVIGLNPASDNIQVSDTTTNYILNNLLPMGYTTITLCNLFSFVCTKLRTTDVLDNTENREYIQEVLKREFSAVLIGYGNTYTDNKRVIAEKQFLDSLLMNYKGKVVEVVDKAENYSRLKTIHPLFAGQRFSGQWKFRKYVMEDYAESEVVNHEAVGTDFKRIETEKNNNN